LRSRMANMRWYVPFTGSRPVNSHTFSRRFFIKTTSTQTPKRSKMHTLTLNRFACTSGLPSAHTLTHHRTPIFKQDNPSLNLSHRCDRAKRPLATGAVTVVCQKRDGSGEARGVWEVVFEREIGAAAICTRTWLPSTLLILFIHLRQTMEYQIVNAVHLVQEANMFVAHSIRATCSAVIEPREHRNLHFLIRHPLSSNSHALTFAGGVIFGL
jgi:hypothetical protein